MNLKLAGYETKPQQQFQQELTSYSARVARGDVDSMPPTAATPVYADAKGRHFVGLPMDDSLVALPFIPGSPAMGTQGGFVPVDSLPQANWDKEVSIMSGVGAAIEPEAAASWLGAAATNAALGGAPGTPLAAALASLGMPNPMAAGVLGGAVAAAANAAGLGRAGSLLGGALGGGPQGLANALGAQALSGLLRGTSLGGIPGMGAVAGLAGGQLSNLANLLTNGGFGAGLDQAAGLLGGLLGGRAGGLDPGAMADTFVEGGCTDIPGMDPTADLPSLESIGAQALDEAANMLLDQWQVDDESSAAEHIAHKLVNDNRALLKEAAQDPEGLIERLQKLFTGETSTAVLPAARLADTDLTKPEIIALGVATILAQGQPISRITDPLSPSAAWILEGSATVLSAGLPTARLTSKTDSPGIMIDKGAPTVLVGGPTQAIDPPTAPPDADPPSNDAPPGPATPEQPGSGSDGGGEEGDGGGETTESEESTSSDVEQTSQTPEEDVESPSNPNQDVDTNEEPTPTLTVHVDQPGTGADCDTYEGLDVGHVFITLDDGKGNQQTVGFYPETGKHAIPGIHPTVPGELRDDVGHRSDVTPPPYPLTGEQYDRVRDYIDQSRTTPPAYDLDDHNCTDWAIEAARRGGVTLPDTRGSWPGGGGSNPGHLGENLTPGRGCNSSTPVVRDTPRPHSPPPRNYHLPGETSPRYPHLPLGPGNEVQH